MKKTRRKFIKDSGQIALGMGLLGFAACGSENTGGSEEPTSQETVLKSAPPAEGNMFFNISLAQWSLHKSLGIRGEKKMDNLDFAATTRNDYGIDAVEYVSQFFKDKAKDMEYLKEMNKRAADNGVKQLLIMVDGEGGLAELDRMTLQKSIENHYKWVDAAKFLGCHSIRVNAYTSSDSMEDAAQAAINGLGKLSEYAKSANINVIVENHGGFSSNGEWLAGVMKQINMPNCGTLPDFGNFCIKRAEDDWTNCLDEYDRYKGVTELMPFAKAVSAKSHDFNEAGDEIHTDYMKMMKIVKDHGYTGYVGIEYEGSTLSESEGIKATKALLEKVGKSLS